MSIQNYNDLTSAITNWLDHTLYVARYPEFIELFEATAARRLRIPPDLTEPSSGISLNFKRDFVNLQFPRV